MGGVEVDATAAGAGVLLAAGVAGVCPDKRLMERSEERAKTAVKRDKFIELSRRIRTSSGYKNLLWNSKFI